MMTPQYPRLFHQRNDRKNVALLAGWSVVTWIIDETDIHTAFLYCQHQELSSPGVAFSYNVARTLCLFNRHQRCFEIHIIHTNNQYIELKGSAPIILIECDGW